MIYVHKCEIEKIMDYGLTEEMINALGINTLWFIRLFLRIKNWSLCKAVTNKQKKKTNKAPSQPCRTNINHYFCWCFFSDNNLFSILEQQRKLIFTTSITTKFILVRHKIKCIWHMVRDGGLV